MYYNDIWLILKIKYLFQYSIGQNSLTAILNIFHLPFNWELLLITEPYNLFPLRSTAVMFPVSLLHADHHAVPWKRYKTFFLYIILNLAVILEHFTQNVDAPNTVWSHKHLPYYAVSTEPAQLLSCGENVPKKNIISVGIYMQKVKAASYILHIYIAYMYTFCAAEYVSTDSCN